MAFEFVLLALTVLSTMVYCQSPITSSKRGLVYVPSDKYPQDDAIWDSPSSDLSWYYNYASKPSASFAHFPKLQFVPMLWGAGNSTTFLSDVQSQINAGANITHVLGFNEPDGNSSKYVFSDRFLLWTELRSQGMSWEPKTSSKSRDLSPELNVLINEEMLILKILVSGGSSIPAETAARIWMQQIEPLAKQGVKLGAPACTGTSTFRRDLFPGPNSIQVLRHIRGYHTHKPCLLTPSPAGRRNTDRENLKAQKLVVNGLRTSLQLAIIVP